MRFDFDAYEKVYPTPVQMPKPIESAVDTFKPTEAEKAMEKPGAEVMAAEVPEPAPEPVEVPETNALTAEGEQNGNS